MKSLRFLIAGQSMLLVGLILSYSTNGRAKEITQTDIVRAASGELLLLNPFQASQYCNSHGAHLPSLREFAAFSSSHGARGIVDACNLDPNCHEVVATNWSTSEESGNFFFSTTGFKRPEGDLGRLEFWAAAGFVNFPEDVGAFDGDTGWVGGIDRFHYGPFICKAN